MPSPSPETSLESESKPRESGVCPFELEELRDVSFLRCNPQPRFETIPDCKNYTFDAVQRHLVEECKRNLAAVFVAKPKIPDFFIVQWVRSKNGDIELEVKKRFNGLASQGKSTDFGRVVFSEGKPNHLLLGDAHLPLEFEGRRADLMR